MEVDRVKHKPFGQIVFFQNKFKKQSGENLPKWIIKSLIKKYGFQKVIDYLTRLDVSKAKNPIGYLTEAIKNNWVIPEVPNYLEQYEARKKEELKEADQLRASRGVKDSYFRQLEADNQRRQEIERQKRILKQL